MEIFNVNWSSYDRKNKYTIGFIINDNQWIFKYNLDVINDAIEHGFRPFPEMTDINMLYRSPSLFPSFRTRYKISDDSQTIIVMKNSVGDLVTDKILIKKIEENLKKENR